MPESFLYADFPASSIAERVSAALTTLPARKLLELTDAKKIIISENNLEPYQTLTYRNLRCQHLDDYAQVCNMPMQYVLFGNKIHAESRYSYFDKVAIALINALPPSLLPHAKQVFTSFFHNPLFDIPETTPSGKLVSVLLMGGRLPKDVPAEQLCWYQTDINEELLRFRKARKKERHIFHIDSIADLCTYCRVSPHWVFSSELPMFCKTSQGDDLFDVFCLLSRHQQICALSMLLHLCKGSGIVLSPEVLAEAERTISEEGRVVL